MSLNQVPGGIFGRKRVRFYRALSLIADAFAGAHEGNYGDVVNDALGQIGELTKADRVYVFRYDFAKRTTSNTFEWCRRHISHEIDNLQDVPLEGIEDWVTTHQRGELLYIPDVKKLLPANRVRQILEPQGVQSLITIPLVRGNALYGFLGFDSVMSTHTYSKFERAVLQSFADLLIALIDRSETQRLLESRKQRIDHIVDAASLGTWEWDLETGEVKYNDRWAEIVGYTLEELRPHTIDTWKRLTVADDLASAVDQIGLLLQGVTDVYECEFRMLHKDGHNVWVRDTGKIIEWVGGRPKALLGSHIDVTQLKAQQQALNVIKQAVEYSPAAVLITDSNAAIEYANLKFTELTGYSLDEVRGRNPRLLQSGEHDERFYSDMWRHLKAGRSWESEFHNMRKDGSLYWESARVSSVTDERGVITHYIAIKTDISDRREQEAALERHRYALEKEVERKAMEIENSQRAAIVALAKLTESRDYETGQHVQRVQYLCKLLASTLKDMDTRFHHIDAAYLDDIFFASALHDIGKINIPDAILLKPGRLDPEEFDVVKGHVRIGGDILSEMARNNPSNKIVMGARIARFHHERWDGNGYVEGLVGHEIPLEARIMSVVDVYDALRSRRPYKEGFAHPKTAQMITEQSGTQFDPAVIAAFEKVSSQFAVIFDSFA